MDNKAFDLGEELKLRKVGFFMHPDLWDKHKPVHLKAIRSNWTKIKYLNDAGDDFHNDVDNIPDNLGGIYLFVIRCPVMDEITEFLVYVGRAQKTDKQNLKKRCKEYFQKYSNSKERPKITRMFKYWKNHLYLYYQTFSTNQEIIDVEDQLIDCLIPPFNPKRTNVVTNQAINAFQ
jgi:hypothetical protein